VKENPSRCTSVSLSLDLKRYDLAKLLLRNRANVYGLIEGGDQRRVNLLQHAVSAARGPDIYFLFGHDADVNPIRASDLLHESEHKDAQGPVTGMFHGVRDHGGDFLKHPEVVRACRKHIEKKGHGSPSQGYLAGRTMVSSKRKQGGSEPTPTSLSCDGLLRCDTVFVSFISNMLTPLPKAQSWCQSQIDWYKKLPCICCRPALIPHLTSLTL
jgi:hypothetical protein